MKATLLGDSLKWLILVNSVFALFPFYNTRTQRFQSFKFHYVPIIIYVLITLLIFTHLTFKQIYHQTTFQIALTLLMTTASSITNCAMIITASHCKLEEIRKLFGTFNQIDKLFATHRIEIKMVQYVCRKTLIFTGCLAILVGLDFCAGMYVMDVENSIQLLNDNIHNVLMFLGFLLQYFILKNIYLRFHKFNLYLDYVLGRIYLSDVMIQLNDLILLHIYLSDLVQLFNSIFGLNMFFEFLYSVSIILYTSCLIMTHNTESLYYNYLWICYGVIQTTILAMMCEKISLEGKRTIKSIYKGISAYTSIPGAFKKIHIFAQQARARCPRFSAAGFFRVDVSALFTFLNLMTTYIIVTVQFSSQNKYKQFTY